MIIPVINLKNNPLIWY